MRACVEQGEVGDEMLRRSSRFFDPAQRRVGLDPGDRVVDMFLLNPIAGLNSANNVRYCLSHRCGLSYEFG
jgi:hypothetical protein